MNVFEEFQSAPNELLTESQIRRKEKMAAVVNDYNDLKEKYGARYPRRTEVRPFMN